MGNPEHKKLKSLLDKNSGANLDDFEKEALEGFDMLNSEAEALDLKSKLDTRIQEEVLKEKKSRRPLYWIAAAAMLILTGLSVWFILSDTTELIQHKDLAVITPKEGVNKEPVAEKSFEAKAAELKPTPGSEPFPSETPAKKRKSSERPELKIQEEQSKKLSAADEVENDDNKAYGQAEMRKNNEGEIIQNSASKTTALPQKDKINENEEADKDIAANTGNEKVALKKETKKAKALALPASQPVVATEVAAPRSDTERTGCGYIGGEVALNKDLEEKLIEKGVNKAFEVILLLDHQRKVAEVQFFKPINLTNKELKKVENILMSLDKFDGKRTNNKDKSTWSCIHRLSYKPSK